RCFTGYPSRHGVPSIAFAQALRRHLEKISRFGSVGIDRGGSAPDEKRSLMFGGEAGDRIARQRAPDRLDVDDIGHGIATIAAMAKSTAAAKSAATASRMRVVMLPAGRRCGLRRPTKHGIERRVA